MTLEEAVAAFEKDFTVIDAVGFPNNENVPGSVDASRAPNGEQYVSLCSGGIKKEGDQYPAYYASEEIAAEEWLKSAWQYADKRGGKTLYWRRRPEFTSREYIAIDQAAMMNDPELRQSMQITVGQVYSRLLVTKASAEVKHKSKPVKETAA